MDNESSRLNDLNRNILLANGEYNDLVERIEAMLASLNVSALLLEDRVKRIGEAIRKIKGEADAGLNGDIERMR